MSRTQYEAIVVKLNEYKKRAFLLEFIMRTLSLDEDDLRFLSIIILDDLNELSSDQVTKKIQNFIVNGLDEDNWKIELNEIARTEGLLNS